MIDLWPDDIGTVVVRSPAGILREQASLLGEKTQHLVEAEVEPWMEMAPPGFFVYAFRLVAPTLGHYRYKLFTIAHDVVLYPVEFSVDSDIQAEISPSQRELGAPDEGAFLEILEKILGSQKTRRVVQALLTQAEPATDGIPF